MVVESLYKIDNHRTFWKCNCDCGGSKIVRGDLLNDGTISDCGCVFKHKDKSYKRNIIGQRFGMLTVINEEKTRYPNGRIKYINGCKCDCGNNITVNRQRLISGKIIACDMCLKKNCYDLYTYEYGVGYCKNDGYFLFDKKDYDKIKNYSWYKTEVGYIRTHIDDTHSLFMHNLIYGEKNLRDIDHINRCKYDNRKSNLREANRGDNVINREPISTNKSGVTGVNFLSSCGKWNARIMKDNIEYPLGIFENFDDAVKARRIAENELFGEYSYLK